MKIDTRINLYKNNNIPEDFAKAIAILDYGVSALDILLVADSSQTDKQKVSALYFKVADYFYIDWMRKSVEKQMTDSYWNRMSIQALKDDLYDKQRRILQKVLAYTSEDKSLDEWLRDNDQHVSIFLRFIEQLMDGEEIDLNMMILANKQFEIFLRKV
jgi:glutamate dehydrogenase